MEREVGPGGVEPLLRELSYPAMRADAAAALADVTLVGERGDRDLGALVSEVDADAFAAPEELLAAVESALGEPAPGDG